VGGRRWMDRSTEQVMLRMFLVLTDTDTSVVTPMNDQYPTSGTISALEISVAGDLVYRFVVRSILSADH